MNPLVSVIIPTYNGEKYIRECVDSVLQQSCNEIELLVVDDCSTDSTCQILEQDYGDQIRLIQNSKNLGLMRSCNGAFQIASGKYLTVFGQDDVMFPDRIKKQIAFMEAHPDCIVSFANSALLLEESRSDALLIGSPKLKALLFNHIRNSFLLFMLDLQFNSNSAIYLREGVLRAGGYGEQFRNYGETMLWFNLARLGRVLFQNEPLSYYRFHANNMTASEKQDRGVALQTKRLMSTTYFDQHEFRHKGFYRALNRTAMFVRGVLS